MFKVDQGWEYQKSALQFCMDGYLRSTEAYIRCLPQMLMGNQIHGLNEEQRELVDKMSEQYVRMLQNLTNTYLQNFSLNAEMSERCAELLNKILGLKS